MWHFRAFLLRMWTAFAVILAGCGDIAPQPIPSVGGSSVDDLKIDPATGIPYAFTFQIPIPGLHTSDFGFGFGSVNTNFCMKSGTQGCESYGYHLGRDTLVGVTPVGTSVVAPADGIVRITTDISFSGYGADTSSNPSYKGCTVVLEHEFPNGQRITSLLGHVQCESGNAYDAMKNVGNPARGEIVRRGQYLGHVAHYWHSSDASTDWHHVHWGMRKGAFSPVAYTNSDLASYVRGYAPKSEFAVDPSTNALVHPDWMDPLVILAANSDPAAEASADVRRHPSGSLLETVDGSYWIVTGDTSIAYISNDVFMADRYDTAGAVHVTPEEFVCYQKAAAVKGLGTVRLYKRTGTSTVVIAFEKTKERYDFIRWEALLSWGFSAEDISTDVNVADATEAAYSPKGFIRLRPGTLVKADSETEVSIVTQQQTRLPIATGEVYEKMGFVWERVVTVPKSVIDDVAGPRENALIDLAFIQTCALPSSCPGGQPNCGGGGSFMCIPGEVIACVCANLGMVGTQACTEDGASYGSCACPPQGSGGTGSGGTSSDGGTVGSGGTSTNGGMSGNGGSGGASIANALHLAYQSPVTGPLHIEGWWPGRSWGMIAECADVNSSDAWLECDLPVPSGASPFEFQVYLPNGKYWGDHSCDSGGCGQPLGQLTLMKGGIPASYSFVPNQSGPPYYNGHLVLVP